jgi:hypothetical protein
MEQNVNKFSFWAFLSIFGVDSRSGFLYRGSACPNHSGGGLYRALNNGGGPATMDTQTLIPRPFA